MERASIKAPPQSNFGWQDGWGKSKSTMEHQYTQLITNIRKVKKKKDTNSIGSTLSYDFERLWIWDMVEAKTLKKFSKKSLKRVFY